MMDVMATIQRHRLVPIMVIDDARRAEAVGQAVLNGGLPILEVTFRTAAAEAAVAALAGRGDLLVGAGTILTIDQAQRAIDAGARFVVAPGLDRAVVEFCQGRGVPIVPGVATPTEITAARSMGVTVLKYFPAEPFGGAAALKAISAPFGDVKFIPTGGIRPATLGAYLALGCVAACGGSWMVGRQLVADGRFDEIERRTAEAVAQVRASGGQR